MSAAREWFSPAEIVAARSPELPQTPIAFNRMAAEAGWRVDPSKVKPAEGRGGGWLYHISALPPDAQARLLLACRAEAEGTASQEPDGRLKALWAAFKGLSPSAQSECERRLAALAHSEQLVAQGQSASSAALVAAGAAGVSRSTFFAWRAAVADVPREDWLPALAPAYKPTAQFAPCHPEALAALKSDFLRPEKPCFSACYRRVRKLASKQGWLPYPSERALRRRLEVEIPEGVRVLARDGAKKAKTLYPAQKRDRTWLHAMEAVNMDGHRLDVFVALDGGRVARLHLLALQDLFSGKVLAWRLAETENKETVRLVIGDMVTCYGIPERIVLDNGRSFTSKWISGQAPNRFRFKIRDGDPRGLLTTLGVEIVWAKPYSGQSKPIERAFRDLAEAIAKHPLCAGTYTGNKPDAKPENYGSRAIPEAQFRALVDAEIAEHNARTGRQSAAAAGRSFDQTFAESLAQSTTMVRWPSEAQRFLWLLAAEKVRCQKGSGEIHLFGNRFWSAALNAHAGRNVVVRFDPDRLQAPLLVYSADDRLIGEASCIDATGFFDAEAARAHARDRGAFEKALREQARLTRKFDAAELGRLMMPEAAPERPPQPPAVKRLAVAGGRAAAAPMAAEEPYDLEASFSRGLRVFGEEASIIPFRPSGSESG